MNKRIKIMYIIPAEGFGGAERQAIYHINNLSKYGMEVVAVTGPEKKVADKLKINKNNVIFCPYFPKEYGKPFHILPFAKHIMSTIISWIRTYFFICIINNKENVDLIFASRAAGWSLAGPLAKKFSIPHVWRFGSRVHGRCLRVALKIIGKIFRPNLVIANCNAVKDSVEDLIDAPVSVIYNGIETRQYDHRTGSFDLRKLLKVNTAVPVIGLAARPSPDKGMDFLADAVSRVIEMDKTARFCIAGEFGWRKQIENNFKVRGLENNVTFLGHVTDMQSFYSGCDIIVLTSREKSIEGFPNSLMEAMAMGKPVIATDAGGIPELIDNDINGILIKEHVADIFADAIVNLIENPAKKDLLGKNAVKKIRELYGADHTILPLANNITEIINEKRIVFSDVKNASELALQEVL